MTAAPGERLIDGVLFEVVFDGGRLLSAPDAAPPAPLPEPQPLGRRHEPDRLSKGEGDRRVREALQRARGGRSRVQLARATHMTRGQVNMALFRLRHQCLATYHHVPGVQGRGSALYTWRKGRR